MQNIDTINKNILKNRTGIGSLLYFYIICKIAIKAAFSNYLNEYATGYTSLFQGKKSALFVLL
jgi:hypothetical protein